MGRRKVSNNLKIINPNKKISTIDGYDDLGLFNKDKRRTTDFFLNYYSIDDVVKLIDDCGIISTLNKRHAFEKLKIKIDINEFEQHTLIIYDESTNDIPIILLRLREVYFDAVKHFVSGIKLVNIPMLMIDWITLQNPKLSFSDKIRPMPGQNYPGLGMLRQFYTLLLKIAKDLSVNALLAVPEYFHLASIYSKIMKFYDPMLQGKFESMITDLRLGPTKKEKKRSIIECSTLIEEGKLFNYIKNEVEYWHPSEMIVPLERKGDTNRYFNSVIYKELKESYKESNRYRFLA